MSPTNMNEEEQPISLSRHVEPDKYILNPLTKG